MRSAGVVLWTAAVLAASALSGERATAQEPGDAVRGAAFAELNCARCHGIGPGDKFSPVSGLASFRVIANTPGMTGTALAVFLRTPHKEMPNLMIEAGDRADVIAYILSLRAAEPR